MAYATYKELIEAEEAGKSCTYSWRKVPGVTVTQGIWYDLSIVPGLPAPQYYAATPMTATTLSYSTDRGLFHGYAPGKFLRETTVIGTQNNSIPMNMILLDYLMFYPFVDEGTTDVQTMTNVNTLPRYTDGEGVKIMLVTQGARAGAPYVSVSYTNQDGVSGRTTPLQRMNNEVYNGAIATSNRAVPDTANPFLTLQSGDTGVRSVQSVTMNSADVGIFAVVLVKPIAQTIHRELASPSQKDYLLQSGVMPEIKDDAYLNWIVCPNGIFNATILHGELKVIWE